MNITIFLNCKEDYKKKNDYLLLVAETGKRNDGDIAIFIKKMY